MKSNIVFYISDGMIKFLQVSGVIKKSVTAVDVINTEKQNDAQVSQALNAFIKPRKLNFSESRVTLLIPRSRAILRYMRLPSQKSDEIRSMIDLQIGNHIPYLREEVEIDFQVLATTADGYAKVAVVIIPQEIAMRYWKIFLDAKIPVHGMTISSVGLWLLFQQRPDLFDKPGAIFDLDVDHSEICLCDKEHWLTSREIPVGVEHMHKEGYVEILKQWALTQNSLTSEQLTGPVESVYILSTAELSGGLANEMEKIQNNLKIKEIILTKKLNTARGVEWPEVMTKRGVSLASLAGIAFSSHVPAIDLVPSAVRQDQEQRLYQRRLLILGLWVALALSSLGLALGMGFIWKNMRLNHLENQLRITKRDSFKVEGQLQKIYEIENMVKNRLIFSDVAQEVSALLPIKSYLEKITITDGNVLSLEGTSLNSVEINQFQKDMVAAQGFLNVRLDYVNKRVGQQGEVYYFKITCALKSRNGQR